jgi:peptidoglycan/LPS O-acetylase OafA/YrhL
LIALAPVLRALATPYDHWHWFVYKGTVFRMDLLAMGALLTFVWRAHPDKVRRYGWLGLVFPLLTPLLMFKLGSMGGFSTMDGTVRANIFTYEIALLAATGSFLWALGDRFTWILKVAPMRFLGRIAYTFYLIHVPALLLADRYVSKAALSPWAALAGAVAYSTASWYWMERRFLLYGDRRVANLEVESAAA